jgi:hypothetical protein
MPSLHKELAEDDGKNNAAHRARELFDACESIVISGDHRPFKCRNPANPTTEEQVVLWKIQALIMETLNSEFARRKAGAE